ncbi:hypothetical protein EVAR_13007_1 [Eumeta japonica]|uniref:Uncharacterized protein n=1 Tax=Eumeta variegata TaxID=151549 RepID=A0A4C1TY67_EUMVA|nr:hypothetical protein EVAR_13007_1 [Eumeta japonica]
MRIAVTILSLVSVVAADGPYHLVRPAVGAPTVQYQQNGQAVQQLQLQQQNIQTPTLQSTLLPVTQPQFIQYPQQMVQGAFLQGSGYRYSQPIIAQGLVQQQQPQQIVVQGFQQQPQPQQQQLTVTQQTVPVQQPITVSQQYGLPQPAPQQAPQQLPQPVQGTLQLQGAVEVAQQVGQVTVQQIPVVNNVQQTRFVSAQPAPQSVTAVRYQQNFNPQTGYSYPTAQQFTTNGIQTVQGQTPLPQGYASQAPAPPIQVNTNTISGSLQSPDTRVYSSSSSAAADPLDEAVVDRIQNILTENEISTANRAGYVSLVSGVALEGARPSVELTSFVQNSPLRTATQGSLRSLQELANGPTTSPVSLVQTTNVGTISVAGGTPTGNYAIPFVSNQPVVSQNFLPQTQSSNVYGPPQ